MGPVFVAGGGKAIAAGMGTIVVCSSHIPLALVRRASAINTGRADEGGDDAGFQFTGKQHQPPGYIGGQQQDGRTQDGEGDDPALVGSGKPAHHMRDHQPDKADGGQPLPLRHPPAE